MNFNGWNLLIRQRMAVLLPLVLVMLVPGLAHGQGAFPAGGENKARGMESPLASRRASAVLYNPANLALAPEGGHPYLEIGYASVDYSYEHPRFDQVVVRSTTPTATVGYSSSYRDGIYWGVVLFPEQSAKMQAPGLPQDFGQGASPLEMRERRQVLHSGLGLGYKVSRRLQLGLSVLGTYERNQVESNVDGSDENLVDADYKTQYFRPRFGAHYTKGHVRMVATFMPQHRVTYAGRSVTTFNINDDDAPPRSFEPAVVGAGVAYKVKRWVGQTDLNYRQWSKGRRSMRSFLAEDSQEADLKDTLERGLSLAYRYDVANKLIVAAAQSPSPWGIGAAADAATGAREGAGFGDVEGISRNTLAAGVTHAFGPKERQSVTLAAFHSRGVREVPASGDNVGYYQVGMTVLSSTVMIDF